MNLKTKQQNNRITVVDALRGFALVSIMLLHNMERFEVYAAPPNVPEWIAYLDNILMQTFYFLFGGKSYAIFALLFGLTFYIQTHNQEKDGKDFSMRFIWRMVLLLGFGIINTLFYQGEILVLYAIVGLFIIPFHKLGNRAVLMFALILLVQPILWTKAIISINNPESQSGMLCFAYYMKVGEYLTGDSMLQLMKSNITNGRIASLLWYWEVGRVTQTLGLFLLGFLAGRKRIFYNSHENIRFWFKTLIVSSILFIPLFYLKSNADLFNAESISRALNPIIELWSNLAFMLILVSGFTLFFFNKKLQATLNKLSPIGRMSLSNYIIQSIAGASIYYGFGLGLYKYTGATYCLIIGIALAITQGIFSTWWLRKYKRGPFETLWHKLTWIGTNKL